MTIRRRPEDFVVEEIVGEAFRASLAPAGNVAVYELTKTQLTTPEACHMLATALGVRAGLVEYAGLKDKHAVTTQWLTAPWQDRGPAPEELGSGRWRAVKRGMTSRGIAAADIAGNRFRITVRGLTQRDVREMGRRASVLRLPAAPGPAGDEAARPALPLLFVNYFGDQRFGSARHKQGFVARRLVEGDFENALKLAIATPARKDTGVRKTFTRLAASRWGRWAELAKALPRCPERAAIEALASGADFKAAFSALPPLAQLLYVEAFQSHLWNATARRLAESIGEPSRRLHADDAFGAMIFPPARSLTPDLGALQIPMPAPGVRPAEPWGQPLSDALAEEGLSLERLRIPGLRRPAFGEAPRPFLAAATSFEAGPPEPDELSEAGKTPRFKRLLGFDLPRGAYATVLLRALGQ